MLSTQVMNKSFRKRHLNVGHPSPTLRPSGLADFIACQKINDKNSPSGKRQFLLYCRSSLNKSISTLRPAGERPKQRGSGLDDAEF